MPAPYSFPFSMVALLCAAGLLTACGRDEPTVVVQKDGQTAFHTGESGAQVDVAEEGESLDVAAELPAFAPIYPGSSVKTRVADVNSKGAKGGMWLLETTDPVEKVAAFYDEQAKKAGVKPGMFVNEKDSAVRIFGKDGADNAEGALIAISLDETDKLTKIVITAGAAISRRENAEMARAMPSAPPRLQ